MPREFYPSFVNDRCVRRHVVIFFSLLFPVFLLSFGFLLSPCAIVLIYDCDPRDEKIARNVTQGLSLGEAKTESGLNWKFSSKSSRFLKRNYFNKNVDYAGRYMKDLTRAKRNPSSVNTLWNAIMSASTTETPCDTATAYWTKQENDSGTSRGEPNPAVSIATRRPEKKERRRKSRCYLMKRILSETRRRHER